LVGEIGSAIRREVEERIPAGRVGQPADIARAVRFLVDPGADYVNGSFIIVDGGLRDAPDASVLSKEIEAERSAHNSLAQSMRERMNHNLDLR